jgi:phosphoribosyl 1,2-cyclic phosphodiesterase
MTIKILASGSAGNACFIGCGESKILIDAGLSRRATEDGLAAIGETVECLLGIAVSHAHSDHTNGLIGLLGSYQMPVYLTAGTAGLLSDVFRRTQAVASIITPDSEIFTIGDLSIYPVSVPHDCAEPVGFVVLAEGRRYGFVTDIGSITDAMCEVFRDVDFLFLESNHDRDALMEGEYPPARKGRVLENHLSNDQVSEFIESRMERSVRDLVCGHISVNNNDPQLVYAMAARALQRSSRTTTRLTVVPPNSNSQVFSF